MALVMWVALGLSSSGAAEVNGLLRVRITGADNELIPARAWVDDSAGQRLFQPSAPANCTPYPRDQSFSCDGMFEIALPAGRVVIHAEKVHFTGKKWQQKEYAWFTGYTGLRTETAETRRERHPDRILRDAVRRMLPKNKLASKMLAKLKIYSGTEHPHQAQQPEAKELGIK